MRGLYLAIFMLASPAFAQSTEVAINTPEGQLQGTLEQLDGAHAALILPGSGPTDRDGNQLPHLHSDVYRLLAEALAAEGVTTLRIDKRGIGGSFGDPNAVSLDLYAQDTAGWIAALRGATCADCVWLLDHSEGALIAMHAADMPGLCGLVLLGPPGEPLGDLIMARMAAQPENGPHLPAIRAALDAVAAGDPPDLPTLPQGETPALTFMAELLRTRPADLLAATDLPTLVIHGDADFQTPPSQADALLSAGGAAETVVLSGMSHMLKDAIPRAEAESDNAYMATSFATYIDPSLPLHGGLIPAITDFIELHP